MGAGGWLDASNKRGRVKAGDLDIEVAGVHDSHTRRDRYDQVAGPADPSADLRLGVLHSPEPQVMDLFAADGYDLLLAGHTHGGQVCVPFRGALVTNCGLDLERVSGLHRHPAGTSLDDPDHRKPWLHVSAGLGTSPWAPIRFACRPEATLLTLVPRIS
jgi:predicted MPP superfamily phosphohydrolase